MPSDHERTQDHSLVFRVLSFVELSAPPIAVRKAASVLVVSVVLDALQTCCAKAICSVPDRNRQRPQTSSRQVCRMMIEPGLMMESQCDSVIL
jgi:hypothetical protein